MTEKKSTDYTKLIKFDFPNEPDIKYALQINQWILGCLGVWQFVIKSSTSEKIRGVLISILCSFLLGFIIVPGILFAVIIIKDPAFRLRITGVLSFCVMGILKYFLLQTKSKYITVCMNKIISDWQKIRSVTDKKIMVKHARFGYYNSMINAAIMYGSIVIYAFILPQVSSNLKKNNTIRGLAYPCYFVFFDEQKSPAYELVFLTHCCCALVLASITSATCNLVIVCVVHACGQLDIMMGWLENFINQTDSSSVLFKKYAEIIAHHVKIIRFTKDVEKLVEYIALIEIVGCTLIICLLGYYVLLEWSENDAGGITTYFLLLISFIFNIFLYCYIGELLTDKSLQVYNATYSMNWYDLPNKLANGTVLTILISQSSNPIRAGKLINLSLYTFGTIIRTSLAYLNILRNFIN